MAKSPPATDDYASEPPTDPPPPTRASDDPATLHVAMAALHRHIADWGIPVHPNQELLVTNAAKAVMDATEDFLNAGGGTDEPPVEEPLPEEPPPETSTAKSKK